MSDIEKRLKDIQEIEEEFSHYARLYVKHEFLENVNPRAVGTLGASLLKADAIKEKRRIEQKVKCLLEGHEAILLISSSSDVRKLASESIKRLRENNE